MPTANSSCVKFPWCMQLRDSISADCERLLAERGE